MSHRPGGRRGRATSTPPLASGQRSPRSPARRVRSCRLTTRMPRYATGQVCQSGACHETQQHSLTQEPAVRRRERVSGHISCGRSLLARPGPHHTREPPGRRILPTPGLSHHVTLAFSRSPPDGDASYGAGEPVGRISS